MRKTLLVFSAALCWAQLPDPKLTPGALNPAVTQENIKQTICKSGYTKTIRPPSSYTTNLKIKQMAERGLVGKAKDWEEDHRVPLIVGGDPKSPLNVWPEIWPEARLKDRLETYEGKQICAGRITLKEAQVIFLGDFWIEYDRLAPIRHWPIRESAK